MARSGQVRIIPVHKEEIDIDRLAAALLELAMQLARERAEQEKKEGTSGGR